MNFSKKHSSLFDFLLFLPMKYSMTSQYIVYMRKLIKSLVALAAVTVLTLMSTGCLRQDYLMFEDGDFDGVEFSDYDLMQNAELDMDDADRD